MNLFRRTPLFRHFRLLSALLILALSGCSSVPKIISEYKIDVQQGNVLDQQMVAQLKPGQTKEQVRFILGTPVLMDMFHGNRWDYVYTLRKGGSDVEQRKFSVLFDTDNKLYRVLGDVSAFAPEDQTATVQKESREIDLGSIDENTKAPPIEGQGFFSNLWEKVGF